MATGVTRGRQAGLGYLLAVLVGCASPVPSASPPFSPSSPAAQPSTAESVRAGAAWVDVDIGEFDVRVRGMAEGAGRVVMLGTPRQSTSPWIASTVDGDHWVVADRPDTVEALTGAISVIAYGPRGFVARGSGRDSTTSALVPFFLHSADGVTWTVVDHPPVCAGPAQIQVGVWGYVGLADTCRSDHDDLDPRPIYVFVSADGMEWTTRTNFVEFGDEFRTPYLAATDGQRIVALQGTHGFETSEWLWLSDDGGASWRTLEHAIDASVSFSSITFGHGQWIARASQLRSDGGQPDRLRCRSVDGESWLCRVTGVAVPPYLAVTPSGFVGVFYRVIQAATGEYLGEETVLTTSVDGNEWHETIVSGLEDRTYDGIAATALGVFAWGATDPDQDPTGRAQPFLILHRDPLP